VDIAGALSLFLLVGSLLLAVNRVGSWGLTHPVTIGALALAAITLPALLAVERRAERPIIDRTLMRNRVYRISMATSVFHFTAQGVMSLVAAFYLQEARGLSQTATGALLAIYMLLRLAVAPAAGALSDRVGTHLPMAVGNAVATVGLLCLLFFMPATPTAVIIIVFLFLGAATPMFEPAVSSAVMGVAPRDRLGTAAASVGTARQIGISSGVAVAGSVFEARSASHESSLLEAGLPPAEASATAVAFGFHDAALVGAVMALAATIIAAMPHRSDEDARERKAA
jgi:predicted MFS family arabinose efflux permease